MKSRRLVFTLTVAVVALCAAPAWAGVPNPALSHVDPCLRVCPGGDMTFHVEVRDALGNPVPAVDVLIDLCSCPGVVLCPPGPGDPYIVVGCTVLMNTDASGVANFPLRAGGTCVGPVSVFAGGVLLATLNSIASPDQNGDLTVNAVDQGVLAAKLGGPYDPTGDLNCSAALEPGDPTVLSAHLAHSCNAVVPVVPKSWGTIKMLYR